MPHLTQHDVMTMFLALATLLGTAKLAGELMQKLGQPSVLGEIFAGILLGPTVLGHFRPHLYAALFPSTGSMPRLAAWRVMFAFARARTLSAQRRACL